MSDSKVFFITGSSRGLGLGLVKAYAASPSNTVIAGVRDPSKATDLQEFAKTSPGKVHIVRIVSADVEGNQKAAEEVKALTGKVDVLIANAGIGGRQGKVVDLPLDHFDEQWKINTMGLVILFKAFWSLLEKSTSPSPVFAYISSMGGSIGTNAPPSPAVYGAAKAAGNRLMVRLHHDHADRGLVSICVHPGLVASDMGLNFQKKVGLPDSMVVTAEDSAAGLKNIFDGATRDKHSAKFFNYDGKELPW